MKNALLRLGVLLFSATSLAFAEGDNEDLGATPGFVAHFIDAFKDSIETKIIFFLGVIVLIGMGWRYRQTGDSMLLVFGAAGVALILGAPAISDVIVDWTSDYFVPESD
jgi:phosphate/sulfate permease